MGFDEQGFRKAAAAAGYSADEIESHIAKEKQGREPNLPKSSNYEDFSNKEMPQQPTAIQRADQKAKETSPAIPYLIGGGAGAAGAAATYFAGKKIFNSLTDKIAAEAEAKQNVTPKIEPELDISQKRVPGEPTFDIAPIQQPAQQVQQPAPKPTVQQLKEKLGVPPTLFNDLEQQRADLNNKFDELNSQFDLSKEDVPVSVVKPTNETPGVAALQQALHPPTQESTSETEQKNATAEEKTAPPETQTAAPKEQPIAPKTKPVAPEKQPVAKKSKQTPKPVVEASVPPPIEELQTGTGKPAYVGQGPENPKKFKTEYASVSEVPKGYAFVPNAQAIDTVRNNLGQDVYTQEFSKRNFPANYEEAKQLSSDINRSLGRPTREQMLEQGIKPPEPVEGITKRIAGYKLAKVGGVAGALIAVSDLAKAAQTGDRSAVGQTVMGAIPGVGPAAALQHTSLNPNEQAQLDFLRRMEYAKQLGAGNRGQAYDPRKFYTPIPGSLDVPGIPPYR